MIYISTSPPPHSHRPYPSWGSRLAYKLPIRKENINTSGFTLVELLVVVVILVVLAAIAIPLFLSQKTKASTAAVTSEGKMLNDSLNHALIEYPNTNVDQITWTGNAFKDGNLNTLTEVSVQPNFNVAFRPQMGLNNWYLVVGDPSAGVYAVFNKTGLITNPSDILELSPLITEVTGVAPPPPTSVVYAWGANWSGQLGVGTNVSSSVPTKVDPFGVLDGKNITQVSVGEAHTCVVADGSAYCWGSNYYGELGNGEDNTESWTPVKVAGLLENKTVTQVFAEYYNTCAIADGEAYCWGSNYLGGGYGNLRGGAYDSPLPVKVSGLIEGKNVTSISKSYYHGCMVADGEAYCSGDNESGQLGDGTNINRSSLVAVDTFGVLNGKQVTQVAAVGGTTCAIADGSVYCWGSSYSGELGNNSNTNSNVPVPVSGSVVGKTVTQIVAGNAHTCALAEGTVHCWGMNQVGELGDGTTLQKNYAISLENAGDLAGKTVTQIASGVDYVCALAEGDIYCWGGTAVGEFGIDLPKEPGHQTASVLAPLFVGKPGGLEGKTIQEISAGGYHTVALT